MGGHSDRSTGWLTFRLPDPARRLAGVRLRQHAGLPRDRLDFDFDADDGTWRLAPGPFAGWRLEYRLELREPDGRTEEVCDPANPCRVAGPFGDKSVLYRADYAPPAWLDLPPRAGSWQALTVEAPDRQVHVRIWSPAGGAELTLVAHDGPEYDRLAALGHYSAAGPAPAHHLVLLDPGERNEWYSADPAYAAALVEAVLPAVVTGRVVGLGASLGALAMLHAEQLHPGTFDGLFLQSGSFFQPRSDPQESGFFRYRRITRFVKTVTPTGARTALTCGLVEENRRNNRAMARKLGAPLVEVPDAHNMTAWRDALDPHLTGLLREVAGA